MPTIDIYNVEALGAPLGQYHHMTRVKASEYLFIAGMLSLDSKGEVVGDGDFDAQCRQVFGNLEVALNRPARDGATSCSSRPTSFTPSRSRTS